MMCGITGVWYRTNEFKSNDAVRAMNNVVSHRGPDAEGIWQDHEDPSFCLGHRRLSILDLSPEGAQPKVSPSGRFVLTFNGEIYNFLQLRRDLELVGAAFRGRSDTEVLLVGFERWGIAETLRRATGMFAFGCWDKQSKVLTLARDRIGEKPLYYAATPCGFVFGSDLRSLKACPGFKWTVSAESIGWYFRYGYVPAPLSIYAEAKKLLPGNILEISAAGQRVSELQPYWSANQAFEYGHENPFQGSFSDAVDALDVLLGNAVKNQMLSDVPLGAFLSGGIDSSTIVALMQKFSPKPVKTFAIGFEDRGYDEAPYAREVAKHIGTDHTELYVSGADALAVVPNLSSIFDEPFSDSSQIPTYLVAKLARSKVTVALSGDGGDEVFSGYVRYLVSKKLSGMLSVVPSGLTRLMGDVISTYARHLSRLTHQREARWIKLGKTLKNSGWIDIYDEMVAIWAKEQLPTKKSVTNLAALRGLLSSINKMSRHSPARAGQYLDVLTYLPDDIMVKVDRAAMAVSLESRAPFLDHQILEFGASLPSEFLYHGNTGKRVLRDLLYRYVPKTLVDRPKMGFGIPIDLWLKGPLKTWVNDLLHSKDLPQDLGIDWVSIRSTWAQHLSGQASSPYQVWNVAILCDWLRLHK